MKIPLRHRPSPTGGHGAFSHKIDKIIFFLENLNLKGHQNRITESGVTAILQF